MLKIKDNVDLNELEKFGFEKNKGNRNYIYQSKEGVKDIPYEGYPHPEDRENLFNIYVWDTTIEVEFVTSWEHYTITEELPNLLYNLFQAGLIEKVEN